jgi:hypothetical protein
MLQANNQIIKKPRFTGEIYHTHYWGLDGETQQTSTGGELGKLCMMMMESRIQCHNATNITARGGFVNNLMQSVQFTTHIKINNTG